VKLTSSHGCVVGFQSGPKPVAMKVHDVPLVFVTLGYKTQ
jgi:hypothetical protein